MKLAIIPARGGSKRIPHKNIKEFHGKPMIAYSIEAAKASGCFDRIIVSTDDDRIAQIAVAYGALVPFMRPAELADDHATTMDVIHHAISWCDSQEWGVTQACCIYATAPFLSADHIQEGARKLDDEHASYVFSATTFAFPIQRAISLGEGGGVQMFNPEFANVRSQDLPEAYHDAGQFYWGKAEAFRNRLPFFDSHSRCILIPRAEVQDIDTFEDWVFAEALFAMRERLPV